MCAIASEQDTDTIGIAPWEIVVLPRVRKPPLRFRGRVLAQTQVNSTFRSPLEMRLVAREKGGFCVAFDDLDDGKLVPHAVTFHTVEDAMDYLEDRCASLRKGSIPINLTESETWPEVLTHVAGQTAFAQGFAILTGEALATWFAALPPDQTKEMTS